MGTENRRNKFSMHIETKWYDWIVCTLWGWKYSTSPSPSPYMVFRILHSTGCVENKPKCVVKISRLGWVAVGGGWRYIPLYCGILYTYRKK